MGKRIENNRFKECLAKGKLRKFSAAQGLTCKELKGSQDDLKTALDSFKDKNYKWAIIQAYYSMFHAGRALIYSRGYRERSHYCLRVAINELFVKERLMSFEYIGYFDNAIGLREAADYESTYSKMGAKKAIEGAEKFLTVCLEVLGRK